ncbi:MAG: hypothetical protein ABWY55_10920 [Microbacterium sp.]
MTRGDAARPRARSALPAGVVTLVVAAVLLAPQAWPLPTADAPSPVFPRTIASYSWWTTPLSAGDLERATVTYQNGVGVEFLDTPQAIVLGDDGATYRRLTVAEGRSTPDDQGDPARSVLAPDGTFAVVGSGTPVGAVTVVDLADDATRDVPIGEGRSAIPQSIAADGRTVLLIVDDAPMSRYTDAGFRLSGSLVTLDLSTGAVTEHPSITEVNTAAISPDGALILVDGADGFWLLDATSGELRQVDALGRDAAVSGGAFSPAGTRIASTSGEGLQIDDIRGLRATRSFELPGFEYSSVLGWRDDDTVLVQGGTDGEANSSALAWVDATTGEVEVFSTYAPDVTGAALWISSVAAALVPEWTVADTRTDRGFLPIALAIGAALFAGLLAWLLTPRRRAARENADAPASDRDVQHRREPASVG